MTSYSFYNLEPKPNSFDLTYLLPPPIPKTPIFTYLIDENPANKLQKPQNDYIHSKSYELLDNPHIRYTQPQNLKEKLEILFKKTNIINKNSPVIDLLKENLNKEEDPPLIILEEEVFQSAENRYFHQNPAFFCFRCRQPGHYQRTCPEELLTPKLKCLICLDESHRFAQCDSFICYKCLKTGHLARDCIQPNGLACFRCRKRGHKARDCKVIIGEEGGDVEGVICLNCNEEGHVNCNEKAVKRKDGVYREKKRIRVGIDEGIISNLEYFEENDVKIKKKAKKIKKNKKTKKNKKK